MGWLEDDESLAEIFGRKPVTPEYPTSEGILSELLATNKKLLPEAQDQASKIQAFNQEALLKSLREVLGPEALETNKDIGELFRKRIVEGDFGELPALSFDKSAARSLAGGYGGGTSGMERSLKARDLGLLQYEETNRNIGAFQQWTAATRNTFAAPLFSLENFQVSIPQQMQLAEGKFSRDVLAANIRAAPNPGERGRFETNLAIASAAAQFFGGGAINTPQTGSPSSANTWNYSRAQQSYPSQGFNQPYEGQPSPNYDPYFDQEAEDWGGSGYGKLSSLFGSGGGGYFG